LGREMHCRKCASQCNPSWAGMGTFVSKTKHL